MWSRAFAKGFVVVLLACAAATIAEPVRVIYLDAAATGANDGSSWQNACKYLQDALKATAVAEKPVEVRAAQGTYKPDQGAGITPGDQSASFHLLNGVTLKGGYAGTAGADPDARDPERFPSILSGDLAGDDALREWAVSDNSFHVVTARGTNSTAVIEGFTVTAGYPHGPGLDASSTFAGGAGMLVDAASPTVLHCCFVANYPVSKGALLACNASNPVVTGCTFLNNDGTGMHSQDDSNPVVTDCRFEGNTQDGMENQYSSPVITGCLFIRNRQYGIHGQDCNSILIDCVFEGRDSEMRMRGIQCDRGSLSLRDCTFTGLKEGGIGTSGDLDLLRCTFASNGPSCRGVVECSGQSAARECMFLGNTAGDTRDIHGIEAGAIFGADVELHDCEFIGNWGASAGAIRAEDTLVATGCVFSGNSSQLGAGAIRSSAAVLLLSNCTFAGNRGQPRAIDDRSAGSMSKMTQCIIRDGPNPFELHSGKQSGISVTYSNVEGGYPGQGNIDLDPCFVDPGHWVDANDLTREVGPDDPCAVWVAGDYHLKSQGGHWDRGAETWVRDAVTSACVDAGDPNGPLGSEPFPNGGVANLGAYGGTAEASKSYFGEPICGTQMAGDINGDCKVDQADMDILLAHWLMEGIGLASIPPTITVVSPEDGAELTYPTPIVLRSAISDPGGTVLRVTYTIEHRIGVGRYTTFIMVSDPPDDWAGELAWSRVGYDGTYAISAELLDSRGIKVPSPRITITLHPAR